MQLRLYKNKRKKWSLEVENQVYQFDKWDYSAKLDAQKNSKIRLFFNIQMYYKVERFGIFGSSARKKNRETGFQTHWTIGRVRI